MICDTPDEFGLHGGDPEDLEDCTASIDPPVYDIGLGRDVQVQKDGWLYLTVNDSTTSGYMSNTGHFTVAVHVH